MINIVIIGGGFGGIYSLLGLLRTCNKLDVTITLFNKTNYFLFTPLLHEVATGGLNPTNVAESIRELAKNPKVEFIEKKVDKIDFENKCVYACDTKVNFDYLIIATGSESNPKGILGYEHCFTLKDLASANTIKQTIIERVQDSALTKHPLYINVIGAGSTGVELVCEIQELIVNEMSKYYETDIAQWTKIGLISSGNGILVQEDAKFSAIATKVLAEKQIDVYLGKRVKEITKDSLTFDNGKTIRSDISLYTGGVKANLPELAQENIVLSNGQLPITDTLTVQGYEYCYAVGDCAQLIQDGKPLPMLAQTAVRQAETAAQNIYAQITQTPQHNFRFEYKGTLISLGQWNAVANIYGVIKKGKLIWWVWRTIYLFKFISPRKRIKIAIDWTVNLFSPRDIVTY